MHGLLDEFWDGVIDFTDSSSSLLDDFQELGSHLLDQESPLDFGSLVKPYPIEMRAVRPGTSIGAAVAGEAGPTKSPPADEVDGVQLGDDWEWAFQGAGTLTIQADWDNNGKFDEDETVGSCTETTPTQGLQECTISKAQLVEFAGTQSPIDAGSIVNVRGAFTSTDVLEVPGAGEAKITIPYGEIVDLPWTVPHFLLNPDNNGPAVEPEQSFDFGDAPNTYGTRLVDNGPRHRITDGVRLGRRIDREPDGQPSAGAWRDDAVNRNDEDGVFFTSAFNPGNLATVDVGVSRGNGLLDAWMDWNQDGMFAPNEKIFNNEPVTPGLNALSFTVPNVRVESTLADLLAFPH